jgi:putative DNA primase/helicase
VASLEDIVGSYTPLIRNANEWSGTCPIESHDEPLAVIGDRVKCVGCGFDGDALAFLRAVGHPDPEHALSNGAAWTPCLQAPAPPPPRWGLHRALTDTRTILITDNRRAAARADEILTAYCVCAWPDGGRRWDGLDPLKGRAVLLWPSPDGLDAMLRLEGIIADPAGLACTGKVLTEGMDIAAWTGSPDELVAWAKAHVRPLRIPQVADVPPPGIESAESPLTGAKVVHPVGFPPETPETVASAPDAPPAEPHTDAPQSPETRAEPPPVQEADFPPDALKTRPKRPPRRLRVVGGGDVPQVDEAPLPAPMSEDAIADDFAAAQCEDWRYVRKWDCWFQYDGDGWRRDETELIDRLAVEQCRRALQWTDAGLLTPDQRRRVGQRRTAGQVRDLARSDRRIAATAEQWDTDPMLMGCPGGVIDLRTGKLIAAERESYITLRAAVAPAAGKPTLWLDHLNRTLQGDTDTIAFLRRYLGYMLTGEVGEHCLVFFYGTGRNGKGTIVETVIKLLGDYGYAAPMNLLMESKSERHPTELASLRGRRAVSASEPPEGARWDDGRIRFLTGGDTINARGMRQDPFTFEPTHKLLLMGNHIPSLRSVDPAMQARFKLIEFNYFFPPEERDIRFMDKLRAEWPQIMNWMLEGCLEWQDAGLGLPEKVEQATAEYMQAEDEFGEWVGECLEIEPSARVKSSDAYANFSTWAEKRGSYVPSQKSFTRKLKERGFKTQKSGVVYFIGFNLRFGVNL